jgi:alkylhydroperoxidase/carboxymuconolactone decarboxylase family protein YurZ
VPADDTLSPSGASARCEVTLSAEETFRRLVIGDPELLAAIARSGDARAPVTRLDEHIESLIRIAVLVPLDAPQASYQAAVGAAVRAGASLDDVLGALLAVAGWVGSPQMVTAASRIALAAGYDVDAALECVDPLDDG